MPSLSEGVLDLRQRARLHPAAGCDDRRLHRARESSGEVGQGKLIRPPSATSVEIRLCTHMRAYSMYA